MNSLSFQASPQLVVVSVVAFAGALGLSVLQWRRRGRRVSIAFLEIVRLLGVAMLCMTLLRPEILRKYLRTDPPEVAILSDATGSMATRDMPGRARERREWLDDVQAKEFWTPIAETAEVAREGIVETDGGTDLNAALEAVLQRPTNLKAVLLLTDGDWNTGKSPVGAATKLRARGVPVFAVGVGSERFLPDLALENVNSPTYGLEGEQISIPFAVRSSLEREVKTTLELKDGDRTVARKTITIPALGRVQDTLVWSPSAVGEYDLRLQLPLEEGEYLTDNNAREFRVAIREEKLRVLLVDSRPRWEYRFLRNALDRDPGVEVDTLLLHPEIGVGGGRNYLESFPDNRKSLSRYDVVFLGDVGIGDGELTDGDVELIKGLVEQQGTGLVLLPGRRGRLPTLENSPLASLLPVEFDPTKPEGIGLSVESVLLLTRAGREHLLTMLASNPVQNEQLWKSLPGFNWSAAVRRSTPGSEVLAMHSTLRSESGRMPLMVSRTAGNGKVLFLGIEGAWRWRRGVEDRYHYRFWGQVVRWMAHKRHLAGGDGIRLSFSPENPQAGDTVFLQAAVFDPEGFPAEGETVTATVTGPSGSTEQLGLRAVEGGWGVYAGEVVLREGGRTKVTIEALHAGRKLDATMDVGTIVRERIGQPADFAILRELAAISRGAFAEAADLDRIVQSVSVLPNPEPIVERIRIWASPWWGLVIFVLFAIYWTARKLLGMV